MIINDTFVLQHRTKIRFGPGEVINIGEEIKKLGKKALIICDQGVRKAKIADKIEDSLKKKGIDYVIFDQVMANPRDKGCDDATQFGLVNDADIILGVGGGSAMDTAKAVSVLMSNGKNCTFWADPKNKINKKLLPVVCVPTTSGTGSEVTFEAVITDTSSNTKISISDGAALAPKVAIMDPELTFTVPPLVTASTGMDALTHALEAYTCLYAQPISDALAIDAMKKISKSISKATKVGSDIEARTNMMLGSLMAGMAFTNSFLGSVHSLSETIGGMYDTPHGIANSIFLPFVTEFNMSADYEKHANVAKYLGIDTIGMTDEEASQKGVEKLFELNKVLGIPKFNEIKNVDQEDFDVIAEKCVVHGCSSANPRPIQKSDYVELLRKAYR